MKRARSAITVVALAALVACGTSCLLTSNLDDLKGGTKDTGIPETCDPTLCTARPMAVKLTDIAPCTTETTDHLGCRRVIHDLCAKQDPCCAQGGFGPVAFPDATEATIVCVTGVNRAVDWPTIVSKGFGCTSTTPATSDACMLALHSYESGIDCDAALFQYFDTTGKAQFICFETGSANGTVISPVQADWTDLTAVQAACTQPNVDKQACVGAVHQYCRTQAAVSGFGPVQIDTATPPALTLACVQ